LAGAEVDLAGDRDQAGGLLGRSLGGVEGGSGGVGVTLPYGVPGYGGQSRSTSTVAADAGTTRVKGRAATAAAAVTRLARNGIDMSPP